jgi:hypothetical protein
LISTPSMAQLLLRFSTKTKALAQRLNIHLHFIL